MSWWNTDEENYEKGVEDGKNSGFLDGLCHSLGEVLPSTHDDDVYDAGWRDGVDKKD